MASGFALRRNGSCLGTETECGETVSPYHACCPSGSFCPHQYNVACCPTAANCTQTLLPDPQCANADWDLFDNNGYFCCLRGLAGYATPGNTDGCAEAGYRFQDGEQLLRTISTGKGDAHSDFSLNYFRRAKGLGSSISYDSFAPVNDERFAELFGHKDFRNPAFFNGRCFGNS